VISHDQEFKNYLSRFTDRDKAEAFLEGFELGCQGGGLTLSPAINN
jgi:hypothetical protein